MQSEDLIRTFIDEAFNKGSRSILEEVTHPDYQYRSPDSQLKGTRGALGEITRF